VALHSEASRRRNLSGRSDSRPSCGSADRGDGRLNGHRAAKVDRARPDARGFPSRIVPSRATNPGTMLLYLAQECLDLGGEPLGSLNTADVSDARQCDQARGWDRGAEGFGNMFRCPDVGLTMENDRGHLDLG
jgi:hypothetical protein